jgi:hypothetical protein
MRWMVMISGGMRYINWDGQARTSVWIEIYCCHLLESAKFELWDQTMASQEKENKKENIKCGRQCEVLDTTVQNVSTPFVFISLFNLNEAILWFMSNISLWWWKFLFCELGLESGIAFYNNWSVRGVLFLCMGFVSERVITHKSPVFG